MARRIIGPYRSVSFVSGARVAERVVNVLVDVCLRNSGRDMAGARVLADWHKKVRQLIRELKGGGALRTLRVVEWYAEQPKWNTELGKMIPRVDTGRSLYDKFQRLEACMIERTGRVNGMTAEEIVVGLFGSGTILADSFRRDIMPAAARLDLGGARADELASKLAALYSRVSRDERGSMSLIRRYLAWLGEKGDWRMTTRVLDADSPAWKQFRREDAALNDPR